jgi:hypothetical protein
LLVLSAEEEELYEFSRGKAHHFSGGMSARVVAIALCLVMEVRGAEGSH